MNNKYIAKRSGRFEEKLTQVTVLRTRLTKVLTVRSRRNKKNTLIGTGKVTIVVSVSTLTMLQKPNKLISNYVKIFT